MHQRHAAQDKGGRMKISKSCFTRLSAILLTGIVVASLLLPTSLVSAKQEKLPEEMKDKVKLFSTMPMLIAAESLGITEIEGKRIRGESSQSGSGVARKEIDVGIGINVTKHENEPTVVFNPRARKNLVAGSHFFPAGAGIQCVAYTSSDNGATWSAPSAMPMLTPASSCSDPVLAYSPDGSRVYYAYMDIKGGDYDIVVSHSDDNGMTWSPPVIALNGIPPAVYDKPWVGTHIDDGQSNWVYVTATHFTPTDDHIAFTRSLNQGVAWSSPTFLDTAVSPVVVQGSRPTGGMGGEVLVAWYNSSADGFLSGSFKIRTARSGNNGATFDAPVDAAVDMFEAPFWLGPGSFYHRWWGSMFPDVEIDTSGTAHITYTHDPVSGSANSEDGDIRYISSVGAPYNAWSMPVTVSDDSTARAQGYAALETQRDRRINVIWEDHRLSPVIPAVFPNSSNLYYDMFYASMERGAWSGNVRASDASSINDFVFIGDYNDLTATNQRIFGIWTDRRHQTSILASEDNVFGSRILP